MKVYKVTEGYVVQVYDTKKKCFVRQSFYANNECSYEDYEGNPLDPILLEVDGQEMYLPYNMVQPNE